MLSRSSPNLMGPRRLSHVWNVVCAMAFTGVFGAGLSSCKDLSSAPSAGSVDPSTFNTPEGAVKMAKNARYYFQEMSFDASQSIGLMTDELQSSGWGLPLGVISNATLLDARLFDNRSTPTNIENMTSLSALHQVRRQARQARHALMKYAPDVPTSVQAEMFIYEGLMNVYLADVFCSGIPLSTVDFEQDFTYRPGSTTVEVYTGAIAMFDSAIALSGDSLRVQALARVSKARTLLALGQHAVADTVVANVPDGFRFTLPLLLKPGQRWDDSFVAFGWVANRDGGNGLPFRDALDPRVRWRQHPQLSAPARQVQYVLDSMPFFTAGSAVEARLIQAEAALNRNGSGVGAGSWLAILNALRSKTGVAVPADTLLDTLGITGCGPDQPHWCLADGVAGGYFQVPAGYTLVSTTTLQPVGAVLAARCEAYSWYNACWTATGSTQIRMYVAPARTVYEAGTGGVAGLEPLTDPGLATLPPGKTAFDVRLDLIFRERGFWLYLTGRRQGDLRRLVRNYRRKIEETYPMGAYSGGSGTYETWIDIEMIDPLNPYFRGCEEREANR